MLEKSRVDQVNKNFKDTAICEKMLIYTLRRMTKKRIFEAELNGFPISRHVVSFRQSAFSKAVHTEKLKLEKVYQRRLSNTPLEIPFRAG